VLASEHYPAQWVVVVRVVLPFAVRQQVRHFRLRDPQSPSYSYSSNSVRLAVCGAHCVLVMPALSEGLRERPPVGGTRQKMGRRVDPEGPENRRRPRDE